LQQNTFSPDFQHVIISVAPGVCCV